jgi:hypothetical protein
MARFVDPQETEVIDSFKLAQFGAIYRVRR